MEAIKVENITLELARGDIASQDDLQAVVNAANAQLKIGGGVAGAIHRAAGKGLAEEAAPMAPIKPGEAVITGGHNLPNDYVIHCLGPVYGRDKPENELLANCYKNALKVAEDNEIDSVGFPAISTGAFGYPKEDAARVAFSTINDAVKNLESVKQIRFVLWGNEAMEAHQKMMEEIYW